VPCQQAESSRAISRRSRGGYGPPVSAAAASLSLTRARGGRGGRGVAPHLAPHRARLVAGRAVREQDVAGAALAVHLERQAVEGDRLGEAPRLVLRVPRLGREGGQEDSTASSSNPVLLGVGGAATEASPGCMHAGQGEVKGGRGASVGGRSSLAVMSVAAAHLLERLLHLRPQRAHRLVLLQGGGGRGVAQCSAQRPQRPQRPQRSSSSSSSSSSHNPMISAPAAAQHKRPGGPTDQRPRAGRAIYTDISSMGPWRWLRTARESGTDCTATRARSQSFSCSCARACSW
jgi:hypothetical protein